ncbi:hypothetical protein EVAR_84153_1 [Eumeta japonica]|uniref:Uncharacterized protein n=1 Tax=Eumeta variegata TaxID=151549 RepID=A0A4C2A9V8_EUMVA|nr:hypothetical protein EVAR_84153_1 [Eumeta japonica]
MFEVEREKAGRAQAMEEAERRLRRESEKYTNKYKIIEANIENMAAELKKTRDAIENMDMPGKMEGLRKTLEEKPKTYAAAAAKPKPSEAAKPQTPGLMTTPTHTIIVSSRCANHTSDQVVKAIREVVDAREMGVGVDRNTPKSARLRKEMNEPENKALRALVQCATGEAVKKTLP